MTEGRITYAGIQDFTALGEKIRKKYEEGTLEFGDPDVAKYNDFASSFHPLSLDDMLDFTREIVEEYECLLREGDEELRFELQKARENLKDIAKAVKPYLPKDI